MRLEWIVLAVFMVGGSFPALAADEFLKGVYLQSEELCAQARNDGIQAVIEAGNVLLTSRGLESVEYNCEFLQVTRATRSPAWAVTALCQQPGYLFPDVLSVLEMSPTQIDVVSVKSADEDSGNAGNTGSYHFCEGVSLP
jgi:hypothetical protein